MRHWIAQLIEQAPRASPTLERIIRLLQHPDWIVHLDDHVPAHAPFDGRTRFVGVGGAIRYLRIDLRPYCSAAVSAALLAHELQHAWEAVDSRVTDVAAYARLYDRIGLRHPALGRDTFETAAAVDAGRETLRELTDRRWSLTLDLGAEPRCAAPTTTAGAAPGPETAEIPSSP